MSSSDRFAAQILVTSAGGYAGMTASLLLERHPEIAKRYEPDGLSAWKAQIQRWLLDLSAALEAGEPKLFEGRMLWTRTAFVAREAPVEDLHAALEALRDVLRERLPAASAEATVRAIGSALEVVRDPRPGQSGELDRAMQVGPSALSYLEMILEGRPRDAIELLLDAVRGGTSVKDVYLEVLLPAQCEAGRLWHVGELGIAEEHIITATTQRAMAMLHGQTQSVPQNGKSVLLACVAGNVHDIGIRAISDFFEMAGWRTVNLGPDVPHDEIARSVEMFGTDVVVLAATLDPHLTAAQRAIEQIRALEHQDVKIIVGGKAFEAVPDLWRKVGADGYASKIEDTEPLGARLTRR